jgi:rubrerythrin
MDKQKKDYKHIHETPIKAGDKYICPKCQAELPINQPCPSCKAEIDWTKI